MITLLVKDFKLLFSVESKKKILSLLLSLLFIVLFITLEVYLYSAVINKITNFKNASYPFTVLFIFIIFICLTIYAIINANKLLFNKNDLDVISHLPIFDDQIILSKLIILLFITFITSLIFIYPIQIAFGIIYLQQILYYYLTILFNFILSLVSVGIALVLVYPYKLIIEYLKKHLIIQFIVAITILFTLSFLYAYIIDLFVNLVSNNNIEALFTITMIDKLKTISTYLFPVNNLVEGLMTFNYRILLITIPSSIGIFILGVSLSIIFYRHLKIKTNKETSKAKSRNFKVDSQIKALIKKELTLIFKDSNNIFSYSGLLIVMPFLLYLVVKAINTIFTTGTMAYYAIAINNLTSILDLFIVMMFVIVINQGASDYIKIEGNNIQMFKLYPIDTKYKLLIKIFIPYILSTLSLLISLIVLLIFNIIVPTTMLFTLIITLIVLLLIDLVSLYEELKNKYSNKLITNILCYLIPIISFIFMFIMAYLNINIIISYFIVIAIVLSVVIYLFINFNKIFITKFNKYEYF